MIEHTLPHTAAVILVSEDTLEPDVWLVGIASAPNEPSHTVAFVASGECSDEIAHLLTDPGFWPEAHDGTVDWEAWATHWLTDIAPDEHPDYVLRVETTR